MTQKVIEAVVAGLVGYVISFIAIHLYSGHGRDVLPENQEYELRTKRRVCLQLAAASAVMWTLFHL